MNGHLMIDIIINGYGKLDDELVRPSDNWYANSELEYVTYIVE